VIFVGNIRPYFSPKAVISCSSFQYIEFQRPLQILTPFYIVFIIWASLQSSTGGVKIPHLDKVLHIGVYGLLAMIISLAWPKISKVKIWAACLVFGGLMELAQGSLTSGRMPSVWDFTANGAGALAALIVVVFLNQKFTR